MSLYPSDAEVRRDTLKRMIVNPNMSTIKSEPPTNSEDHSVDNTIEKEAEAAENQSEAMKLVVRSPYWGRILKGKTRRNYDNAGIPGRPYRVIGCQAVLSAVEGQYWGCCPHHGKRVLELRECHFTDHFAGNWNLYMIGSSVTPSYMVHAFFMLPQNQTLIDISYKTATQGWTYVGTANASVVRMDLEAMLTDILKQNDGVGFRYHHVHLEILMDQVFDRETPRSRKAAIELSRTDRGSSNSSTGTPPSSTSVCDGSSAANTPPIPHVVTNDAQWFSDATHSPYTNRPIPSHHIAPGWSPEAHYYPTMHPMTFAGHEQVQWYPASLGHQIQAHSASLQSMNPAQQLLHQGYVQGSNTILPTNIPTSYITPAAPGHYYSSQISYSPHDPHSQHYSSHGYPTSSYHSLSQIAMPEEENRDDGDDAVDRENGAAQADEKFNEDGATASFSETTADEDDGASTAIGEH